MKHVTAALLFITFVVSVNAMFVRFNAGSPLMTASVFFKDSVTAASLKLTYQQSERGSVRNRGTEKVKILIVPGHDAQFSGTVFNGLKEVELNVALGKKLYDLLRAEQNFDVFLSQTTQGYTPEFSQYFEDNQDSILKFIDEHKYKMTRYVEAGEIDRVVAVEHNTAPSEVAIKLFGINKWANENGVDIVIHVHFNDYPGRKRHAEPKYSGFSIYVPESQYSNAKGSKSVAESVFARLNKLYPHSDLPVEDSGIVEDQELIAIGSNNTLDAAAMLIEYGYIYESAFYEPTLRDAALSDLALQTYLGVMDFFGKNPNVAMVGKYQTAYLPHVWQEDVKKGTEVNADILRLQAAMVLDGVYPPAGKEQNDCPLTGTFGPCTEESVKVFQEKYDIAPAEGFVGEQTRAKLNEIFGG